MDKVPELKNMMVIDSKDTNAVILHSGGQVDPPKPVEKPADDKVEDKTEPTQEAGESDDDYAKRLGLTKEQHEGVTETIKKAVGKKHRQYKEAEEFAKDQYNSKILAEERAAKAERELQRLKAAQEPAPAAEVKEPARADFKTDAEYNKAMIAYGVQVELDKREKDRLIQAQEDLKRERETKYNGQMANAREVGPDDFQETMESVEGREDIRLPEAVSVYLNNESDKVPEVLYHLIKTPEVLESIWKMSPMRQVGEIVRLEGILKSFGEKPKADAKASQDADKASPTAIVPSKARAPAITPITQGSESQVSDTEHESFETALQKYRDTKAPALFKRKRH